MDNPFAQLFGRHVKKAEIAGDWLQITFEDGTVLTVINDYTISGVKKPAALRGFALATVIQDPEDIVLVFEDDVLVRVSLAYEAYHGPEAMVMNREGETVAVWN